MNIEVHTFDKFLVYELLGKSSVSLNDEVQVSDQIILRFNGIDFQKAVGLPEIINLILALGSVKAIEVASKWLHDKLKGKKIEKLVIEKTEVEIDQGEIKRVIEEKLKIEKD